MAIKIITTCDGSHSLFHEERNETYHSVHGALQESRHVFIANGLEFWMQQNNSSTVSILEVGFGSGLNALLTLQYIKQHDIKVMYTTIEAYPLKEEIWRELNYTNQLGLRDLYESLHKVSFNECHLLHPDFNFLKLQVLLEEVVLPSQDFDLVYFDAFAPSKQPELWELPILNKILDAMKPGGVFVTYCAKGQLKRDLANLGLKVESLAGPPGKKEMVRAIKP